MKLEHLLCISHPQETFKKRKALGVLLLKTATLNFSNGKGIEKVMKFNVISQMFSRTTRESRPVQGLSMIQTFKYFSKHLRDDIEFDSSF